MEVLGNIGRSVSLPCNTTSSPSRTVALVMWFKGDSEDPFYSLDLRHGRTAEAAKHWAHHGWSEKVKFHFEEVRRERREEREEISGTVTDWYTPAPRLTICC